MTKLSRAFSIAILTAVLAAGCAARSVRVAELKDRPDKYSNKTVTVTGVVTNAVGIPLLPGLYKIDDGSGEIYVLSNGGRIPRTGSRVQVKGKVDEVGVFGGRSVGLHLRESDHKVKN